MGESSSKKKKSKKKDERKRSEKDGGRRRHHRHDSDEHRRQNDRTEKRKRADSVGSDDRMRSTKRVRDEKDHSKKNKKRSRSSRDENHRHRKSDIPDKSSLVPLGPKLGHAPGTLLDTDTDYFQYHQQLWVYLYREEGKSFNDLSSDQTRKAFGRFVERYNRGDLEGGYYGENMLAAALQECKTTHHSWSFAVSGVENRQLEALSEGVRQQTEFSSSSSKNTAKAAPLVGTGTSGSLPVANENEREQRSLAKKTAAERYEERKLNRRLREHDRVAYQELTGRGGGKPDNAHERQLEQKRTISAKTHGAARDRDDAAPELPDAAVYGDTDGKSFHSAVAREKQRKAKRGEQQQQKLQKFQDNERAKQQAMLAQLGLDQVQPGTKIQIAPRRDG